MILDERTIYPQESFDPRYYLLRYYDALTLNRLVALSLAIRLYQSDHGGKAPDSLSQLVPNYMPAIPSDPFDRTGAPLQMRHGRGLLLYSTGLPEDHSPDLQILLIDPPDK